MSILKVARLGHPVLRQECRELTPEEVRSGEFQRLARDMAETMMEYTGVGLAGPQVHVPLRLFIMDPDPDGEEPPRVVVNPVVTPLGEETAEEWEGCLSIPDVHGKVPRHLRVRLEALDLRGEPVSLELEGFAARVCQHETDHLGGVLFLDRMRDLSTLTYGEEFRRYWAPRDRDRKGE